MKIENLTDTLKEIEWNASAYSLDTQEYAGNACPYCKCLKIQGHVEECKLNFILKNNLIAKLENRLKAIETLHGNSFGMVLNANDFYGYSCADTQYLEDISYDKAIDMIEKFGLDGLNALMSKHSGNTPIEPHLTDKFKQAIEYLNNYKKEN